MALDALYQAIQQQEWVELPAGWGQGRTIYGGLAAAMLMQKALCSLTNPEQTLLSASITFVGPIEHKSVKLTCEVLRQGKSVTTLEVRLWQNNEVQSILLVSFGLLRESYIHVAQTQPVPNYAIPEDLFRLPKSVHLPECFDQFELVWAELNLPCTGSRHPDFGGWCRFNPDYHNNRPMTVADLMVMFDIWPPGVMPLFKGIAPASTLTWTVTYVQPLQHHLHDWFKYKVVTDYAAQGYATEMAYLWDQDNRLIAIARQTVTVFA